MKYVKILCLNLLILVCLLMQYRCNYIATKAYGIKTNKVITKNKMAETLNRFCFWAENHYYIDSTYFAFLPKLTNNSATQKDFLQPLQLFCYNNEQTLISHIANCNAQGFPNLKWDNLISDYLVLPIPVKQTAIQLSLTTHLDILNPIAASVHCSLPDKTCNYTFVVYWSYFMGRQNEVFLKEVAKIKNVYPDNCCFIFVNCDNIIP